ncbi:Ca2+:H+ antiporter [Fusarium oxysporum f. sp. lycopersici MN25]|nr:Ca2+:H+ antiporter [Fusarium oxysporum f. sp. lycopersici MN25]
MASPHTFPTEEATASIQRTGLYTLEDHAVGDRVKEFSKRGFPTKTPAGLEFVVQNSFDREVRTHSNLFDAEKQNEGDEEGEGEELTLGLVAAIAVLVVTTVLVTLCADYLVNSINGLVTTSGISRGFIGLILVPIVGNAAEHVTAVVVALRDKMDLAIGIAVGSSIQIALLVAPFLVIVS